MRIGQRFTKNNNIYEVIEIIEGAFNSYVGTIVLYRKTTGKKDTVKVRTLNDFLSNFDEFI